MGIQRYRFDKTGEPQPNGAIPLYTVWMGGPSLAGIRNCPCDDGVRRTVYIMAEADTYFTQPAAVAVNGRTRRGFVTSSEAGLSFTFNAFSKPEGAR